MIRPANKYDLEELRGMMRLFRQESPTSYLKEIDNQEQFDALVYRAISGAGLIFIEPGKGFILGLIVPSVWCNKTLILHELAWFVKQEFRNGIIGAKLLKTFLSAANDLKNSGRIKAITMAKMVSSPTIKYEKLGFSKLEEIWIA